MSVTVVATTNETSFAVAYADATALVLDALAVTGQRRTELFERAKVRAKSAKAQTMVTEEEALSRQLLAYIGVAELQRWNV